MRSCVTPVLTFSKQDVLQLLSLLEGLQLAPVLLVATWHMWAGPHQSLTKEFPTTPINVAFHKNGWYEIFSFLDCLVEFPAMRGVYPGLDSGPCKDIVLCSYVQEYVNADSMYTYELKSTSKCKIIKCKIITATYAVKFAGCVSTCIHKQNLCSSKLSLGEMWASRGGRGTVLWSAWCAAKAACAETCWCGSTQCGAGAPWDGGILWRPLVRHCEATRAWISHIRWIGDKECNHVFIFSAASIGLIRVRTKRFRCNSNSKWFILYSFQFNISFAQTNLFELTTQGQTALCTSTLCVEMVYAVQVKCSQHIASCLIAAKTIWSSFKTRSHIIT